MNYFDYYLQVLDLCLLHYFCHLIVSTSFFKKLLTKRNLTSPLLNYVKGITSRFGVAIQVLPSEIGEYFSSFSITVVVVVFIQIFIL